MASATTVLSGLCLGGLLAWLAPHPQARVALDQPSSDRLDVVLAGDVTSADKGTYQEHSFEVPAGTVRIDVAFTYQHKSDGTELEIGLFDPVRFRGTSRFSKERFHIGTVEATPSYLPGPIVPGTWRLSLGVPAVAANARSAWRTTIRLSDGFARQPGLAPILVGEPRWYTGDLHAHTLHSDAFGCQDSADAAARGCQPWEVVEAARRARLDFLAITDHNTTSHHADLATLQESLPDLLLLRGQELTTFRGHANVYGTSAFIDFRLGFRGRSMSGVLDDVERESALLSINHPARETGDRCTGCGWDAPETPWERIKVIEAVNGAVIEGPTAGLPFWYRLLNEGRHIVAIGGSDDHAARSARGRIGAPSTVVFATALSEPALLDGIRSGRVYVRTRGPAGPSLDFRAVRRDEAVPMGGTIPPGGSGAVALHIEATAARGQTFEIVRNGAVVLAGPISSDPFRLSHDVALDDGQWAHVRLRDGTGVTAFSNPIYAGAMIVAALK